MVGIPESAASFYCEFADTTGIILRAAVPLHFAVGHWAIHSLLKGRESYFLIVPGQDKHRAFFVVDGQVKEYMQAVAHQHPEKQMATMIHEVLLNNPVYEESPKYIWMSESVDFRQVMTKFNGAGLGLESLILIDRALVKSITKMEIDPNALVCDWIAGEAIDGHASLNSPPLELAIDEDK